MIKHLALILTVIFLCGCGIVSSSLPIGDSPANIQDQISEWDGTWLSSEGVVAIKVTDATNGIIEYSFCETNQGKGNVGTGLVFLREGGGWMFANYEIVDGTNSLGYLWGKIVKSPRQILVWLPDSEKIEALVESGQLPGIVEYPKDKRTGQPIKGPMSFGKAISLGNQTAEHLQVIISETNGPMVDWQNPMTLIKQSHRNDQRHLRSAQKRLTKDLK